MRVFFRLEYSGWVVRLNSWIWHHPTPVWFVNHLGFNRLNTSPTRLGFVMKSSRFSLSWFPLILVLGQSGCSEQRQAVEPKAPTVEVANPATTKAKSGEEPTQQVKGSEHSVSASPSGDRQPRTQVRTALRPSLVETNSARKPPEGKDWSLSVQSDGGLRIFCHGATVIKSSFVFWGAKWQWAGPVFRAGDATSEGIPLTAEIKNFNAKGSGMAREIGPGTLEYEYQIQFNESVSGVKGGGMEWALTLDSPVFPSKPNDPTLLDNQAGWTWRVGESPEDVITVRFDPPAANVYAERNQMSRIRTFFVDETIPAGLKTIRFTVSLPRGGRILQQESAKYGPAEPERWFHEAQTWDSAPVDLSFLNKNDRPAGKLGRVRAEGDQLVLGDGTPARFWGGNLTASALFATKRDQIPLVARRLAQLGYNLMRLHHHDSSWVGPNNIFVKGAKDTKQLERTSLESIDYWIKCLKDQGIYVWLDAHVGRELRELDPVSQGVEEIRRKRGEMKGFNYFNPDLQTLMRQFQTSYLTHVNSYTGLAYKDDPAILAVLITNENDLTFHFGNMMLGDKGNPVHNAMFNHEIQAFAEASGLPAASLGKTWEPGPSKIFLNYVEHRFNQTMIGDLRKIGFEGLIATTNFWGSEWLSSLPALTEGNIVDAHAYGQPNSLEVNPRYEANFISWLACAQVYGKPLTITEWSIENPHVDRFVAPLYLASIASLQGWDAPMQYCYSQGGLNNVKNLDKWGTAYDPAYAMMPAAALIFRLGYVSPAKETYCLMLDRSTLFDRRLSPEYSATIRTLAERSKLTIGMPEIKELPWLKPSQPTGDVKVITDPDQDFIPQDMNVYRSDTGELERDWERGIHKIDTPKAQAASGWIGGTTQNLTNTTIKVDSPNKAAVALTSVDGQPLSSSHLILVTAIARVQPRRSRGRDEGPLLSEPIVATIHLKTQLRDLQLLALGTNGRVVGRSTPSMGPDGLEVRIPSGKGTHWYVLKSASDEQHKVKTTSASSVRHSTTPRR